MIDLNKWINQISVDIGKIKHLYCQKTPPQRFQLKCLLELKGLNSMPKSKLYSGLAYLFREAATKKVLHVYYLHVALFKLLLFLLAGLLY